VCNLLFMKWWSNFPVFFLFLFGCIVGYMCLLS
jgi:hypothetical protein